MSSFTLYMHIYAHNKTVKCKGTQSKEQKQKTDEEEETENILKRSKVTKGESN